MPQPSAPLHLRLYGQVAWVGSACGTTVAGRPAELLSILALRQPEWVSAESLIDRLWERPPASGANAVQRIVARARRQLDDLGADAKHVVESSPAGYRLVADISTDLQPPSDEIFEPPCALVAWWAPPLANVDLDRAGPVRAMLDLAAARHCRRWVDDVVEAGSPTAALTWLLAHRRIWQLDPEIVDHALRLADLTSDHSVRREVATQIIDVVDDTDGVVLARAGAMITEPTRYADFGMLTPCSSAIEAGNVGDACRALDDVGVADEVRERVEFWLGFAPLDDGFT
ncbi:MAG: winged helix-turn-helix domain-containing protein, partial [Ilumatobacter sp.]|nr:winged helix-turn-helix domain-containing protein [Ilumatobacter sp.]